ncbi:TPA: hypothetical protein JAN57_03265 [Legionella pneumophila]|nr:hypothetical protein [Legionella pneumophila]HAU1656332.1 hypothetical protein [Legionella pneumophila]
MDIEHLIEQIYDDRTKEYFEESYSAYQNGHYRSAIVSLWNIVVCDIFFKLEKLTYIYNDTKAKAILEKYIKLLNNENAVGWEANLVREVCKNTYFVETVDLERLLHLQKLRHLAAHPVMIEKSLLEKNLFKPTKSETRSQLENVLKGLIIKSPIYTKNIFNDFVTDLATNSNHLQNTEVLKKYMESKFFSHLNQNMELDLYKSLWRITFYTDNEDCNSNRKINCSALSIMTDRNKTAIKGYMSNNSDYFSQISTKDDILELLTKFMAIFGFIYPQLTKDIKILLKNILLSKDCGIKLGWFLHTDLDKFHDYLVSEYTNNVFLTDLKKEELEILDHVEDSDEWLNKFNEFLIFYYGQSNSFAKADSRFNIAIKPYLNSFRLDQLVKIIEHINSNNQIYGSYNTILYTSYIKERIDELDRSFDYSKYPNFQLPD